MKNRIAHICCATLLCLLPSLVSAQDDASLSKETQKTMAQTMFPAMLKELCAKKPFMMDDPDFALALRKRPINPDAVCKCFNTTVMADVWIKQAVQDGTIIELMQSDNAEFDSHGKARFTQALMACTAAEMDESLKLNVPKR